jgi:hypothetical protein
MEKDEDCFVPPAVTPRFLIGEFTDPRGRPYVMLVNKDLKYSFKFDIDFRVPIAQTLRVSPYTGAEERLEGEQNWIPPRWCSLDALRAQGRSSTHSLSLPGASLKNLWWLGRVTPRHRTVRALTVTKYDNLS